MKKWKKSILVVSIVWFSLNINPATNNIDLSLRSKKTLISLLFFFLLKFPFFPIHLQKHACAHTAHFRVGFHFRTFN